MIKRGMNLLMLGTVAVLSLLALAFGWLMYTESGANWLWARATSAMPQRLSADSVEGSLRRGLRIRGLTYRDASAELGIESLAVSLNPDLVPTAINVEGLAVRSLRLQLLESEPAPSAPLDISELLTSLELPFLLRLRDARIDDATIVPANGEPLLAIDTLQLSGEMRQRLAIDAMRLQADDVSLQLNGSLDFAAPHALDLTAMAEGSLPATISADQATESLQLTATGNLRDLQLQLFSESQRLTVAGSVSDIADNLQFDLAASAPEFRWPLNAAVPQLRLEDVNFAVAGDLRDYQFELQSLADAAGVDGLRIDGRGSGDSESVRVDALQLRSQPLQADLSGSAEWASELAISAAVTLQQLDPSNWQATWPEGQPLSGELAGSFRDQRLELASVQLAQRNAAARVTGNGIVDLADGIVDLSLTTTGLQWPIAPATADVSSPNATLTVSGSPDDWQVNGDIALGSADFPEGRLALSGGGNRNSLQLNIAEGDVLGGGIQGDVFYDWSDAGRWQASLAISNARTATLFPSWPGTLSADIRSNGSLQPLNAELDIRRLDGELRARPVTASGQLQLTSKSVTVTDLQLRSAASTLVLNGATDAAQGLNFDLDIDSLTDFLPGAAGQISASGNWRDQPQIPLLQLDLQATNLAYQAWSVAALEIDNAASVTQPFQLNVNATELIQDNRVIDSATLSLQGNVDAHDLTVTTVSDDRQLQASLRGELQRQDALLQSAWQGSLQSLLLTIGDELDVALRDAVPLTLSAETINAQQFCLDVSGGGAVCGTGRWRQDGQYSASLDTRSLPLNLLRHLGLTDLVFTQSIDGTVQLGTGPSGKLSADGRIDLSPGEIRNSYDERLTLKTRAGFASIDLQDGQLLAGEISLPFSDAAEIRGKFEVIDVNAGTASPISGSLVANVRNIGVAAQIVPQIDAARGVLAADLRAAGTLDAPEFSGELSLRDAQIAYDPLGLRLEDLQLDSRILPGNRIELESTFRSGDGSARLTSSADYLQGQSAGLELTLQGERLRLIGLPELSASVNPDLKFGLQGNDVSINGRLGIDSARLASVNFIGRGVNESDDVVLVGDESPDGEEEQPESGLNFSGSVLLDLGSNIVIDLDVAEARLSGQTEFSWQGPALPMANGAFDLTGKFEAYGQLLEITEGGIRFPNVPADSPLLRIRAEREIFGNSQVRRAGVLVSGSALQPQVSVYTNPATSQDRALTLLITGSDFNYEQGVGAVDVGTYIAPNLYASYGIGLFHKENVISVRYDLAKGFGIKATSGKSTAGIDISYTISR